MAGVVRIYAIHECFAGYDISCAFGTFPFELYKTDLFVDYGAEIWMVSNVETNFGIIFTCLHASRPILSRILPEFFGEVNRASSKNEQMNSIHLSSIWTRSNRNWIPRKTNLATEMDAEQFKISAELNSVVREP